MINTEELNEVGWTIVSEIETNDQLIELGNTIGKIQATPNGEIVKEIIKVEQDKAPVGSQSSIYGGGPFPLHTDTVFWSKPVKYIILRASGDLRRPTTVDSFATLLQQIGKPELDLFKKSVWVVGGGTSRFYCSLMSQHESSILWRYDKDLMTPANKAAIMVEEIISPFVLKKDAQIINWEPNIAVIISNWKVLHGRGEEPIEEGLRTIFRLYIN